MEASTGKIGGFDIGNGGLHAGSGDSYVLLTATDENHYLWFGSETAAGANFRVSKQGKLFAKEAEIYGKIEAVSGKIGDFDIGRGGLHAGSGSSYVGLSAADENYRMWVGAENSGDAPFRVNHAGKMFATDAEISGKVTASSGKIGGFDVGNGGLHAGSGSSYVGLSAADENYYMWFGAEQAEEAPFRVTKDGAAYLTRLYVTDENGVAQSAPVNLNTSYWKLNRAVKTLAVNDNILTIELYNGTSVNFKKADGYGYITALANGSSINIGGYKMNSSGQGEIVDTGKIILTLDVDNKQVKYSGSGFENFTNVSGLDITEVYDDGYSDGVTAGANGVTVYSPAVTDTEHPGGSSKLMRVYMQAKASNGAASPVAHELISAAPVYDVGYKAGWAAAVAKLGISDNIIKGPGSTVDEQADLYTVTAGGSLNNITNTAANYFNVNGYAYAYINGTNVASKYIYKSNQINVGQ